jgi:hypothetical protein
MGMSEQDLVKFSRIKFNENALGDSRVLARGHVDRKKAMDKTAGVTR